MTDSQPPIFIIVGPARSGTTYLASLLQSKSKSICYFEEPNALWMYKNGGAAHDCRTADDASPEVIQYIRKRFLTKFLRSRATCLLEKTPANCLRLPFVQKVFPDAKYIFIDRNISEIAISARAKWVLEIDRNTERLYGGSHKKRQFFLILKRFFGIPLCDVWHYLPKIRQELLFFILGRRRRQWGPRYVGMTSDLQSLSIEELCLKQAEECQRAAITFRSTLEYDKYIVVKYEDMKLNPQKIMDDVEKFMGCKKPQGNEEF